MTPKFFTRNDGWDIPSLTCRPLKANTPNSYRDCIFELIVNLTLVSVLFLNEFFFVLMSNYQIIY